MATMIGDKDDRSRVIMQSIWKMKESAYIKKSTY